MADTYAAYGYLTFRYQARDRLRKRKESSGLASQQPTVRPLTLWLHSSAPKIAQLEEPVPIRHWSFELPTVLNGGDSHCIGNLFLDRSWPCWAISSSIISGPPDRRQAVGAPRLGTQARKPVLFGIASL
jgi:hypothetical protein